MTDTIPTTRLAAQVANVIAQQLAQLVRVEPLDARALLLDSVRELFAALRPLLIAREPGEPGVRLVVLVRELEATHRTLAIECEGALRRRAMKPAPAL